MKKIILMVVAVLMVSTVNAQNDSVSLASQKTCPQTRKKVGSRLLLQSAPFYWSLWCHQFPFQTQERDRAHGKRMDAQNVLRYENIIITDRYCSHCGERL